ncbi:hypothetical protein BDZ91DRAFT_666067 [Kalaharituber pfeilii]|nr:hypothetical protein BDZ91DRAFT_666067 [Kalaharituber pfeilii]
MSTANEIPRLSSIAGAAKEQSQAPTGLVSNPSSNVAVFPTPNPGAGASAASTPATTITTTTAASAPSTSNKRKRLPQDRVGQLEDRIAEDPRGDIDAWLSLIAEHQKKGKFDEARTVYERFFLVFPACAEQWINYVKMELANNEFIRVEQIFSRCLIPVLNIELWTLYLNYIRRRQNLTTDTGGRARGIISQAYEFVLNNVGIDRDAGHIWQEYIQFVKSSPGNIGGSGWQDQQKMDLLRKVYQRAICIPIQTVDQIWREYDAFEMGLNKITGRKFLAEKSPLYMTARSSFIELNNITAGLIRTTIPRLPPLPGFEGYEEYTRQVELWKKWIHWEKGDPLVLAQDDASAFRNRIIYVYKQALMALRFCPEIWFEAAEFCFTNELEEQGNEFLKQGIAANPESCLLCFKYAERLEATLPAEGGTGMEGVRRRGQAVRKPYEDLLNCLYAQVAKIQQREKDELARIEEMMPTPDSSRRRPSTGGDDGDEEEDDDEDVDAVANRAAKEAQTQYVKDATRAQIQQMSKTISAVWINLMRAMRRIEGHGKVGDPTSTIGGSRQVFADARKRGKITSDVYVASALMEYHCYKDPAATRIFERGMKLFPEDEDFALEYLKHLIAINDVTNARAVFETFVGRVPAQKAKRVYQFFYEYESQYGDLGQIYKLEKRMGELYPNDPYLNRFTARYSYNTTNPSLYHPIISPAQQLRPKGLSLPPLSSAPAQQQPEPPSSQVSATSTAASSQILRQTHVPPSPKRTAHDFDASDTESAHTTHSRDPASHRPAKKLHRGDSPLKGAAGRRLDQQKQRLLSQRRGEDGRGDGGRAAGGGLNVIPDAVMFLLGIIPGASSYNAVRFRPEAIIDLLRGVTLPGQAGTLSSGTSQMGGYASGYGR